jgi:hypothetical protein
VFALVTMCLEATVMICTRVHYVVDIICGMIIAHYIYRLVDDYVYLIDNSRFSLNDKTVGKCETTTEGYVADNNVIEMKYSESHSTTSGNE